MPDPARQNDEKSAAATVEERIGKLQAAFADSLAAAAIRLRAIHAEDRLDTATRAELGALAHRLSGSAGIFGFDAVGSAARALDESCAHDADTAFIKCHLSKTVMAIEAAMQP